VAIEVAILKCQIGISSKQLVNELEIPEWKILIFFGACIMSKARKSLISPERIEKAILLIRGERVMVDADLAEMYGVATKVLLRAVRRNTARFPKDFAYQLTAQEVTILRRQFGTSSSGWGGRRTRPWAFTEQGVAMLSSVLRSPRAVEVNVEIMRAFVRMRRWAVGYAELARRIDELEAKYDGQFAAIFEAIRRLMEPPAAPAREMGFHTIHKQ
jgi:hypothetical protein